MKLLPLTLLLSATSSVLADKKLSYSCYNAHGGVAKTGNTESKPGSTVDDAFAAKLVKDMPTWSHQKYAAKQSRVRKELVIVACSKKAQSRDEALKAIEEMKGMVREMTVKGG